MAFNLVINTYGQAPSFKRVEQTPHLKTGSRCITYYKDMRHETPRLAIYLGRVKQTDYSVVVHKDASFSIQKSLHTLPFRCHWADSEIPSSFLNEVLALEKKLLELEEDSLKPLPIIEVTV